MPSTALSDLVTATEIVEAASSCVEAGIASLKASGGPDASQVLAYDLAHIASAVATARAMLDYGNKGEIESKITCAFVADVVHDLVSKLIGREQIWGVDPSVLSKGHNFITKYRDPDFLASLADHPGPRHLDSEFEMVQDAFRAYANNVLTQHAEHVHRNNDDVPEPIISGLAEMGAFGLSIPVEYGGYSEGGDGEYLGNVIATEELSRGSLGIGGSLITRPEILARALMKGGTE
jgi:(2S)-methylsuccinyl-CoA dehydrogenase